MKIQAINTSFKGLFTDKSKANYGNWLIEYSPYSWERYNTSRMANQEDFAITDTTLPDNEKIYTEKSYFDGFEPYSKKCNDILGTTFYYEGHCGELRNRITEAPAMNREESLKVLIKKLNTFLAMKKDAMKEFEESIKDKTDSLNKHHDDFCEHYRDYFRGIFERISDKNKNVKKMSSDEYSIKSASEELIKQTEKYIKVRNSADTVESDIQKYQKEANLLEKARVEGKLIDISRRDIYDPNKALWIALQNLRTISDKYIALPHTTVTAKSILDSICQNVEKSKIPGKVIEYIDLMIKNGKLH